MRAILVAFRIEEDVRSGSRSMSRSKMIRRGMSLIACATCCAVAHSWSQTGTLDMERPFASGGRSVIDPGRTRAWVVKNRGRDRAPRAIGWLALAPKVD